PADAGGVHWHLARDDDGIAWLLLDKQGTGTNTLSADVIAELGKLVGRLEADPPKVLVIRSAKPAGFIAGADIGEFRGAADAKAVEQAIGRAHAIVDRLEALKFPTVAVVHGYCLGGGLEIALACRRRIAIEGARFGFPEVMLGLHPGLGGTARLTRLIDPIEAMTLMLTGKSVEARKAKALGLVDAVAQERHVRNAVRAAASAIRSAGGGVRGLALNSLPARRLAAGRMRAKAQEKAPPDHYPAPFALIDLWEQHGGTKTGMLAAEKASFARLMVTETAQNLIRIFFVREKMKKLAAAESAINHVHVIGAGAMGGDIAAWCAFHGLRVTLQDLEAKAIAAAVRRAADLFPKLTRKGIEVRDALDRLIPDLRGNGLARADVVIEAVAEKLDVKRKVFADIEPRLKEGAVLATNTSSIPLEDLRPGLTSPGRLVGLHFFNPVSRMQLVEVVTHDGLAPETLAKALAFVGSIDRLPAPVKSAPGFIVNRALTPYLLEAMLMLDEGEKPEAIDAAARAFGMPVGPVELADEVGLDICLSVGDVLAARLQHPLPKIPAWLRQKVEAGELGRKTGKGLYEWKDGKPVKAKDVPNLDPGATDRLILPILDTCVACLREGLVEDQEIIDGAMVFGTGFAPFRGGPLHYARKRGAADITASLRRLAEKLGDRFAPDPGWNRL
ncbi:MAG: enoyl-CoA hydratase/isomerase family protein, partial [Methylobacteriaceae bacterium]|nr:enoyl-CoA hydratase/isomerase family protein [Methylobacteriaceae bacterium]